MGVWCSGSGREGALAERSQWQSEGRGRRGDLLDLMRNGEHGRIREGALLGLEQLGDATVVPEILAAAVDRRVRSMRAGAALANMNVSGQQWMAWLQSPEGRLRDVAMEGIVAMSQRRGGVHDPEVLAAGLHAFTEGRVKVRPQDVDRLERQLASVAASG